MKIHTFTRLLWIPPNHNIRHLPDKFRSFFFLWNRNKFPNLVTALFQTHLYYASKFPDTISRQRFPTYKSPTIGYRAGFSSLDVKIDRKLAKIIFENALFADDSPGIVSRCAIKEKKMGKSSFSRRSFFGLRFVAVSPIIGRRYVYDRFIGEFTWKCSQRI